MVKHWDAWEFRIHCRSAAKGRNPAC